MIIYRIGDEMKKMMEWREKEESFFFFFFSLSLGKPIQHSRVCMMSAWFFGTLGWGCIYEVGAEEEWAKEEEFREE